MCIYDKLNLPYDIDNDKNYISVIFRAKTFKEKEDLLSIQLNGVCSWKLIQLIPKNQSVILISESFLIYKNKIKVVESVSGFVVIRLRGFTGFAYA